MKPEPLRVKLVLCKAGYALVYATKGDEILPRLPLDAVEICPDGPHRVVMLEEVRDGE